MVGCCPACCRILERKPLTWHGMAWVGSTRMPGSVRCRQTHHRKRHPVVKRTGLLRTAVVGPSSGLAYAGMHCSIPIHPKACERPLSACSIHHASSLPHLATTSLAGPALLWLEQTDCGLQLVSTLFHCPYTEACIALHVRLFSRVGISMSQARHAGAAPHKERGKRRSRQWDCELLCELSFASSTYVYL
jgi:hypothetical protein